MTRARILKAAALLAAALAGVLLATAVVRRLPHTATTRELAAVQVYPAWFGEHGFVFLFSAAGGWSASDAAAARRLARAGQRVIGIDSDALLAHAAHSGDECLYLPAALEAYSEEAQRQGGNGHYAQPALAGHGAGATLVYLAVLQAPALAFSGAVLLDPVPELDYGGRFCDQPPGASRPGHYAVALAPLPPAVPARLLHASDAPAGQALGETLGAALADLAAHAPLNPLADLPLVELPAGGGGGYFAIIYSGDGGWRDLDRSLAYVLTGKGVPVIGVDVLQYYWKARAPGPAAADLARIIRHYQVAWGRSDVLLVGFSFGANVLPFLVNRLPADLRPHLRLLSLLSPERSTAFEVDPRSWLGMASDTGAQPIGPELRRLPAGLVQCVYGEAEAAVSLCTGADAAGARVLRKDGDHHFDGDYDRLADDILAAVPAAGAREASP